MHRSLFLLKVSFENPFNQKGIWQTKIGDAGLYNIDVNVNDDGSIDVITTPEDFFTIKQSLIAKGMQPAQADITMIASTKVLVNDKETAEKIIKLIDTLEDLDDVQSVYSNVDIADEAL